MLTSNTLRRNDEAILTIAYCLRRVNNITAVNIVNMKMEIYSSLSEVLKTDSDLFLFVSLYVKISSDAGHDEDRKSFGRGMKRALFKWYDQKTALELANMFGRNRGMHGW